jgi:hypothetical protein
MIEKTCEGSIEPCGWVLCEKRERKDASKYWKWKGLRRKNGEGFWADEAHDRIENNDRVNGVKER